MSDVPAPVGTVGWSITSGWIEADSVSLDTDLMLVVDDAMVRGVEGPASLAALTLVLIVCIAVLRAVL